MATNSTLRDTDFINNACAILNAARSNGEHLTMDELIRRALRARPSGYYADFDNAYSKILKCAKDKGDVCSKPLMRDYWNDMYGKVDNYRKQCPGTAIYSALSYVLNFQRPERFYITRRKAAQLLNGCIKTISYVVFS